MKRWVAEVGAIIFDRCVRETGVRVTVERTGPGSWVEQEPGWMTICGEHSNCVLHYTRASAVEFASQPSMWCQDCREIVEGAC